MKFSPESPLHELSDDLLKLRGIRLLIKRDELIHGACHGNKFRKLKYHLLEFQRQNYQQIVSFGGAFSNHLYALAALGQELQIKTVGLVRGEIDGGNPTIRQMGKWGMELRALTRQEYRQKTNEIFLKEIQSEYPGAYIIPEGGHHPLAQKGVAELVSEVRNQYPGKIHHWICPVGTGSTAVGMAAKMNESEILTGFVVLKGMYYEDTRKKLCASYSIPPQVLLLTGAHFGGFGKRSHEIENFIVAFYERHQILLDPIYTAKMFCTFFKQIDAGIFKEGSTILALHTGGLQGLAGYNYQFQTNLPEWIPTSEVH